MESIRKAFISIGFAGTYSLGLIDYRHILIKFNIEEDYVRAFLKRIYTIDGFTMRLFKWSTDFSVDSESAILPIWINFPLLPLHFFNKEALYNIARLIGEPLKMDASTAALTRPSVARVCVELDLRKVRPEKIWLVNGDTGFWQPVDYEKIPPLCSECLKIGHQAEACRSTDSRPVPPAVVESLKVPLTQKGLMEYRPKMGSVQNVRSDAEKDSASHLPKVAEIKQPAANSLVEVASTEILKIQNSTSGSAQKRSEAVSVSKIVAETNSIHVGDSNANCIEVAVCAAESSKSAVTGSEASSVSLKSAVSSKSAVTSSEASSVSLNAAEIIAAHVGNSAKEKDTISSHPSMAAETDELAAIIVEAASTEAMDCQIFASDTAAIGSEVVSASKLAAATNAAKVGDSEKNVAADVLFLQQSPPVLNSDLAKLPTIADVVQDVVAKEPSSMVGVSNFDACLSAHPQKMDKFFSIPSDLLAVFPQNVATNPTASFRTLDFVPKSPVLVVDCHVHDSDPPIASTSSTVFNEIPWPMSNAIVSDTNVPLMKASAPISSGILNPNAPLFNPQTHPYAKLSKSFAEALLGEQQTQCTSERPLFFPVKSAEFPIFHMPQFAEFYTSSSFTPPDEASSSFPREDIYTFSDGDDVPRWPASRELISASLKSFNKKLQAKFSMHRRFFCCCPKHRKNWKKCAPISTTNAALSSKVPPPLNALSFHGPNPYEEHLDDNDSVAYESVWRSDSSDEENSFDFSIPLSSEAALLALEFEDFSPPARRKYNKRFRDLPAPMTTRFSRNRS